MFYFTHIEMMYFLIGQNLSPALIYGLSWMKSDSEFPDYMKELITPELFHFGSATIYFMMFYLTHKYISHYIYREDDLTGQNDAIRRMVKDSFQGDTFDMLMDILKKLLFPSALMILNLGITPLVTCLLTISTSDNSELSNKQYFLQFWMSRVWILPGIYIGKFKIFSSLGFMNLITFFRLSIMSFLIVDNVYRFQFLKYQWVYHTIFITFYMSLGYCLINLYAQAAARNEDWKRKKVGFIMFISTVIGLAYGDVLGMTAIITKLE